MNPESLGRGGVGKWAAIRSLCFVAVGHLFFGLDGLPVKRKRG